MLRPVAYTLPGDYSLFLEVGLSPPLPPPLSLPLPRSVYWRGGEGGEEDDAVVAPPLKAFLVALSCVATAWSPLASPSHGFILRGSEMICNAPLTERSIMRSY